MASRHTYSTHLSVLEALKKPEERDQAWQVFVARYIRLIRFWCLEWGVEIDEHDDVFQDTMMRVIGAIENFQRLGSGSFRAWLKDLARKSWYQLQREKERMSARREVDPVRAASWQRLSPQSTCDHLVELFDHWALQELMDLAQSRAAKQVRSETWDTFRLAVAYEMDIDRVVAEQGITHQMAYNRIFRVRRLVRDELARIESQDSGPAETEP